jgi:hypothetical protein
MTLLLYNRPIHTSEMRIQRMWPTTDWNILWKNVHSVPTSDCMKASWYRAIHDIIPTNERLQDTTIINRQT